VAKVPLAEDHDMIKAIPSDRTDEPLRMPILPWRLRCDRPIPDAHRTKPPEIGVVTLRNRMPSPLTVLFIECARIVSKPLAAMSKARER